MALSVALGCAGPAKRAEKAAPKQAGGSQSKLYATMVTSQGEVVFRLLPAEAPKAVENFIGLATGSKAWKDPRTGRETSTPLYSETVFHNVVPGFMIQGGDPGADGTGGPGYRFEDEFHKGRSFNKMGLLAMANSGPDTNGSQFFITLAPAPWLDKVHTIFGELVSGKAALHAIAAAPRDANGRPLRDQILREVRIEER